MPERIDEIGWGYRLIQDTEAFCYGVDAVLLADFCSAERTDKVLDLCCGNGAVSFIVSAKYGPSKIVGVDILPDSVELAGRSAELNGVSDSISFICADAKNAADILEAESFSLVVCNPPYFESGRGVQSAGCAKQIARHESSAGLEDFFRASAYVLRKGGRLCMIHRPERLADLMSLSRKNGLEPKVLRPVVPYPGEPPKHLLIEFVKGGGRGLKYLKELTVRERNGKYSRELDDIYGREHIQPED